MDPFSRIRMFLEEERDLFGETMIAGQSDAVRSMEEPVVKHPKAHGDHAVKKPHPSPTQTDGAASVDTAWEHASSLGELESMISDCKRCPLWETRTKFVFGTGNPHATFMVVGEAPGADEDQQGKPFVGRAGQLLTKILEAIGFTRDEVFIANVLKSRPPNNRKPAPDEVEACLPYLQKQIALIKPKVILCLGLTAAENLLKAGEPMARLRGGRVFSYEGTPLMVTYHPAALLRNPAWKRPTWEDVQAAKKLHDELLHGSAAQAHTKA